MQSIPSCFCISLNAQVTSSLDWKKQATQAVSAVEEGKKILWDIDLGLFAHLPAPLTDPSQKLTLQLALQHFVEKFWPTFEKKTAGIFLFHGSVVWQNNLSGLTIERAASFLEELVEPLPADMPFWLHLHTKEEPTPAGQLSHIYPDQFPSFNFFLEGGSLPPSQKIISRIDALLNPLEEGSAALCLPPIAWMSRIAEPSLNQLLKEFNEKKQVLRLIPEEILTQEWHGLDTIYYFPNAVSPEGGRKLQGFAAAGGILQKI